jgi:hypothetical protein
MSEDEYDSEGVAFSSERVRELQNEDFALDSTEGMTLFAEGCSIVLFYNNNATSEGLMEIWADLSAQFLDVNFFGVNLTQRRDIAKRIGQIRNDANHMFNKFTLAKAPYIIAYRESNDPKVSYPQAFYNGIYSTEELANWISEYGCQPGYTEYVSDTYDAPIQVEKNVVIDEEVDERGSTRSTLTREYNDRSLTVAMPKKTAVQRILAARGKEIDDSQLSVEDYEQMTPIRDPMFTPNKRVSSNHGVGFIKY